MRARPLRLALPVLAASAVLLGGCGGPSDQERAAERANDLVTGTSVAEQNSKIDAQDEATAKRLAKEAKAGDGAVKDVKDAVEGAVKTATDEASAEARRRAERARDGVQRAADEALGDAAGEAAKAHSRALDGLDAARKAVEGAQRDIDDVQRDIEEATSPLVVPDDKIEIPFP